MRRVTGWIVSYLCRWLPHRSPTGLFPIGTPNEESPVIVTANFSLTVNRVRKALAGLDVWLLIVNTNGINVWCAAGGAIFTENRVTDAIKTSNLPDEVSHREIILPALAAPGVDRHVIKDETGFHARFGPVYAYDIPRYLEGGKRKDESMRRFNFGAKHKIDMFVPMNFPLYLLIAVVLGIFWPSTVLTFSAIFWGAAAFLYIFVDIIPAKTGWGQSLIAALLLIAGWAGFDWIFHGTPLAHWGWLIASIGIFFIAGLDLAGTISPRKSDAEILVHRLGFNKLGSLFSPKELGEITLERDKCIGCRTCEDICPVGVYGDLDKDQKTTFQDHTACFSCGACVAQCPVRALSLL